MRVDGRDVKHYTVAQAVRVKNAYTKFAAPNRAQFEPHRDVTDLLSPDFSHPPSVLPCRAATMHNGAHCTMLYPPTRVGVKNPG
ncbi:MAG: hypothetical protein AMXMBFR4_10850 [Candidatus Hydrogenedentota bacterium]